MTMREKIARIMISGNSPELWESLTPESKQFWLERADAVFDALAEPTDDMESAALGEMDPLFGSNNPRKIIQAVMAAAKEGK